MRLQRRSESWFCMPLSFAMALDMPVADLISEIGHDGGAIAHLNLPEPECRLGFHIQEFIHVALRHGFATTPLELFPVLQTVLAQTHTVLYPDNNWQRFANIIATSRGVIEGTGRRCGHMVAYDHGCIFDPKGHVYDYTRLACEAHDFYSRCAWRLDRIEGSVSEAANESV